MCRMGGKGGRDETRGGATSLSRATARLVRDIIGTRLLVPPPRLFTSFPASVVAYVSRFVYTVVGCPPF